MYIFERLAKYHKEAIQRTNDNFFQILSIIFEILTLQDYTKLQ